MRVGFFLSTIFFANISLINQGASAGALTNSKTFSSYWYAGKAEISSYELKQARYGEIHDGHAVLIFVTEDFSRNKQVKLDNPESAGKDRIKVLKLNFVKKFNTGIYPYSMMTSIFTPVDIDKDPRALKITTSSQEWCGNTFTQFNWIGKGYRIRQFSYFESQGDVNVNLDTVLLEDELWNLIRLDPSRLPTGKITLLPGTMFQRLSHIDWSVRKAEASLGPSADNEELMTYTIKYSEPDRVISIYFKKDFPHKVEGWKESYRSGWGKSARMLTTEAKLKKRMLIDYWRKNKVKDVILRKELGLE